MTDEDFQRYLEGRYAEALAFYNKRARQNKWSYLLLSIYAVTASAFLTVTAALPDDIWRSIGAVVGGSLTVAFAVLGFLKCQENWHGYRAAWDKLKREPELHKAGLEPYVDLAGRNQMFVRRVEEIIAHEGAEWLVRQRPKKPEGDDA